MNIYDCLFILNINQEKINKYYYANIYKLLLGNYIEYSLD